MGAEPKNTDKNEINCFGNAGSGPFLVCYQQHFIKYTSDPFDL